MTSEMNDGLRARALELVYREARLLDEGDFGGWADLFTEDGCYWVPTSSSLRQPFDGLSHALDDKQLIRARMYRLLEPRAASPEPWPRTCHLVSNTFVDLGELIVVRSSQVVVEYRARDYGDDDQRVYASLNTHELVETEAGLRIRLKRVDLVNAEAALNAVTIPF